MSLRRSWDVFVKDLRLGPRSPLFFYAIALPLVMSFLVSAVFGSLFDPEPRLGIVDEGSSRLTAEAEQIDGISVTVIDSVESLRTRVEAHDLDAGLVLPAGFDAALVAGQRPDLQFYVSGSSLASNRVVLAVTTSNLIQEISGRPDPVDTVVERIGEEDFVPISDRLLPMVVFYAVVIAALFIPASSLVDEREKRTLDAVLVTPTRMSDVLVAKAALGVLLSVIMGLVTLALNGAFGGRPVEMTVFLFIGSLMLAELGLVLGCVAKNANSLYTAVKGGGVFIFLPVIFTIWPGLPQWIPKIAPTYYFLQPIFEIATRGSTFGDLWVDLAVACGICAMLLPLVVVIGSRAERKLAMTG